VLDYIVRKPKEGAIGDVRVPQAHDKRVAVVGRAGGSSNADAAIRASYVFDDDGLTERRPHPLTHDTPYRIRSSAGSERYNHRDWSRRLGVRPSEVRHARQRGGARCQMEKISAGKFHLILPHIIRSPRRRARGAWAKARCRAPWRS